MSTDDPMAIEFVRRIVHVNADGSEIAPPAPRGPLIEAAPLAEPALPDAAAPLSNVHPLTPPRR